MRRPGGERWEWVKQHPVGVAVAACLVIATLCAYALVTATPPWALERLWERHARLKPAKIDDYIAYGFWVGAAGSGAIALLLAATANWWARAPTPNVVRFTSTHERSVRRFWAWVLVALLLAAALRAPRMDHPLWGDEAWAYQDLMGGRFTPAEDGSLQYRPHDWEMTLFWDKGLNNQYLFSIAARACNDLWRALSGAPDHAFDERALRLPSLLAGLLSIVAFAALLKTLGFARSAIALAFLLAIHPWHIRYSVEARSYAMLILGLAVALICLVKALSTDRRRWWSAFAVTEFASLYAWKAAIHPFVAIHLLVLALLFARLGPRCVVPAMRSLAAGGFALAAFLPLFAPAIPQIALALEKSELMRMPMGSGWFKNVWSQTIAAMDWAGDSGDSMYRTVSELAARSPFITHGILWLVPALFLFGAVHLARRSAAAAIILLAPVIGGVVAITHFATNGTFMHKWYLFYAMPFVMAVAMVGVGSLQPVRHGRGIARLAPACFVAFYFLATLPQTRALVRQPLSDTAGAAARTRTAAEGRGTLEASEHVTVGVFRRVTCYDPRMISKYQGANIRDAATLRKVLEAVDSKGNTLAVTAANLDFARATHPDLFELLDDPSLFEPLGTLPAIERYIRISCWRYRPGSISSEP